MDLEGRSVHSWGKIMRRMTFRPEIHIKWGPQVVQSVPGRM